MTNDNVKQTDEDALPETPKEAEKPTETPTNAPGSTKENPHAGGETPEPYRPYRRTKQKTKSTSQ